ncbi:MAG TPA: hypothetical protein VFH67_02390 [bacterium]|nr:hypothetical protein [bacterium]
MSLRPGSPPTVPDRPTAAQLYWLGYISASGRVYAQRSVPALVVDIDPRDLEHVHRIGEEFTDYRLHWELCRSNLNGLQGYIRDREFGKFLAQWGAPGAGEEDGWVSLALIPSSLLPHFVRGYLEGGHQTPPFGGSITPTILTSIRILSLMGPEGFLSQLSDALGRHAGLPAGIMTRRPKGRHMLTYRGTHARRLIHYAYRDPSPSMPRAARLLHSFQKRAKVTI